MPGAAKIGNMGKIKLFRLAREDLVVCAVKDIVAFSTAGKATLNLTNLVHNQNILESSM